MNIKKLNNFDYQSNVSIFIGENGGGKSEILNKVSEDYLSKGYNIIAIANCIYDKFRSEGKKYHFIGARQGSQMIDNALIDIFSSLTDKNVSTIGKVLHYSGYEPVIGMNLVFDNEFKGFDKLHRIYDYLNRKAFKDEPSDLQKLFFALKRWLEYSITNGNEIFPLNLNVSDFISFDNGIFFAEISKNLKYLKRNNIIHDYDFYFFKNGSPIVYTKASSGELSKIVSMSYIASKIDNKTAILIDEPENSLHPRWQRDYIEKILDVFYMYSPKLILATHSPIIISTKNILNINSLSIYHVSNFEVNKIPEDLLVSNGMESVLWNIFGTITPENNFLSRHLINMLSDLSNEQIDIQSFKSELDRLRAGCYDERQLSVLDDIETMAIQQIRRM